MLRQLSKQIETSDRFHYKLSMLKNYLKEHEISSDPVQINIAETKKYNIKVLRKV